mgnify:CR=1 FL=1|jgi:hypothetical protein
MICCDESEEVKMSDEGLCFMWKADLLKRFFPSLLEIRHQHALLMPSAATSYSMAVG